MNRTTLALPLASPRPRSFPAALMPRQPLNARLVETLGTAGEQALENTDALRSRVIAEASPILERALQNWKHAPDYKVEIVVTSLYWTDASVGRPAPRSRGWF